MAILTGRYGTIKLDTVPASPYAPVAVSSVNGFKISLKTDYDEVTCFGDTNKVYIPGLRDISGTLTGFWNSSELKIIEASSATTPGYLELAPNSNEPSFIFGGLAYIDADLDCTLKAPALSGSFKAAGPWVTP
jgi:hypothetical protein